MKFVYLPIETKVRDFYGKLLLAYHLTQRGYGVIIGPKHRVFDLAVNTYPGVLVGIGFYENFYKLYRSIKSSGGAIVSMDEEGLIYLSPTMYQEKNLDAKTLSIIDRILCWGTNQEKDILDFYPDGADKTVVTGNVRFDMLRSPYRGLYEQEAVRHKEEYGNYYLLNSNTSYYNHFQGADYAFASLVEKKMVKNDSDKRFYQGWFEYQKVIFEGLRDIAIGLSERMPDCKVIIRPHPSESVDRWRQELNGYSNIIIENSGSSVPWIMGARAIIHSGCTTGVEANVLGVPTFSYVPDDQQSYTADLPNRASKVYATAEEAVDAVVGITSEESSSVLYKIPDIGNYMENIKASAIEKYGDVMDSMVIAENHSPQALVIKASIRNAYRVVKDIGVRIFRGYDGRYIMHKFGRVHKCDVIKLIGDFKRLSGEEDAQVISLGQRCYFLMKRS